MYIILFRVPCQKEVALYVLNIETSTILRVLLCLTEKLKEIEKYKNQRKRTLKPPVITSPRDNLSKLVGV